jgi:hypothetical protein
LKREKEVLLKNRKVKYIKGDLDKDVNGLWYEIDSCTTGLGEEIVMEIYKKFKFKEISRTEDVQATVSSRRRRKKKKRLL